MASGTLSLPAIYQCTACVLWIIRVTPAKPNSTARFGDSIDPETELVIVYED